MRQPRRSPPSCWRSPSCCCSSSICCRPGAARGSRMAEAVAPSLQAPARFRDASSESPATRAILIGVAVVFLLVFLLMPLAIVFYEALREGLGAFVAGIAERDALAAIKLTL